MLPLPSDLA